ncbi:TBC1 domain family member 2 [Nematocida ausubeli]|nr:TBC1 domain family member 2 [Nematocida ausubeli]
MDIYIHSICKNKINNTMKQTPMENVQELRDAAWFGLEKQKRSTGWLILLDIISPSMSALGVGIENKCRAYESLNKQGTHISSPEILLSPLTHDKVHKQISKDVLRIECDVKGVDTSKSYIRAMAIFSKRYPVISYVQGMCDIFKLFMDVHSISHDTHVAEALSYFCFEKIVSKYLDYFSSRQVGIERSIEEIEELLQKNRPKLFLHLQKSSVEVKYFAYNWMSTFLIREFLHHKEVFDAHFSLGPAEFIRFNVSFATALVIYLQDTLMSSDFEGILYTLQRINEIEWSTMEIQRVLSVSYIIYSGGSLYEDLNKINKPQ